MELFIDTHHSEFLPERNENRSTPVRFTILVIGSNSALLQHLSPTLTRYAVKACDEQEGLQLARKIQPDLIIAELDTPDNSGESLCIQLKRCDQTSHIPIIILTHHYDHYSRIKSFYMGADDHMSLPLEPVELQIRIENLVQSRRTLLNKFSRRVEFKPASVETKSENEFFLQRIMEVTEGNIDNPTFGSEQFAREMGLSQARLYRKVLARTGYASNDFVRSIRLLRAADLLQKKVGNVSEIAYMVGFNSLSYFAKCFRDFHKCSPRDYMKRANN